MEFVSFNDELGISLLLFKRVFSNIQIERTDKDGKKSWLRIPCVYGQRSRIVKNLENPDRKANYKLPLIAFNRTGWSRQPDRLNNLHNEVKYEITSSRRDYNKLTPVPVDISYDVVIMAKYPSDIDKIASNFMVFFNNDIYVSCQHPKWEGIKMNNQIVMSDSVSEDHPDEFGGEQNDFTTATFNFTFKTYLFGGVNPFKKRTKQISSYLSTVVSSYVHEFQDDSEIYDYLSSVAVAERSKLSTVLTSEVEVTLTSEVDISGDGGYDDGVPPIKSLDFGFYAVPLCADIDGFIMSVDNELIAKHEHYTKPAYISSAAYDMQYKTVTDPDGNQISVPSHLSTYNDYYEPVDNWCTLEPYRDAIKWRIDEDSPREFPYNIIVERDWESKSI